MAASITNGTLTVTFAGINQIVFKFVTDRGTPLPQAPDGGDTTVPLTAVIDVGFRSRRFTIGCSKGFPCMSNLNSG